MSISVRRTPTLNRALPRAIGALALAATIPAIAFFIVRERRTDSPLMPLSLFGNLQFTGANALTVLLYAALSGDNPNIQGVQGGIWRSDDAGNTWTQLRAGQATDVLLDLNSASVLTGNLYLLDSKITPGFETIR